MTAAKALSRTTRLINREIFDGRADEDAIARGLMATTVRLVADEPNMSCRSGQAGLISTFQLIARMGVGVELIAPETALLASVPPLREPTLRAALLELGSDLIPGLKLRTVAVQAEETFVFGNSAGADVDSIYVSAGEMDCSLTRERNAATRIECDFALGGLVASAAAAALALEAALPQIEREAGISRTERRRPSPGPPVNIDLTKLFPTLTATGVRLLKELAIDAISAGAITNAFVAVAVWLLETPSTVRVIDDDIVEASNVNRCPQIRSRDERRSKVDVLRDSGTALLRIAAEKAQFTEETAERLEPLAEHVLVGVDDIPSRWRVQEAAPKSLYVGATTNREAILTTHHPGEPCAGCAHPDPAAEEAFVPTISFVSFWGGLLQACALLAELQQHQTARRLTVFPFALGECSWFSSHLLPYGARCAIACSASGGSPVEPAVVVGR